MKHVKQPVTQNTFPHPGTVLFKRYIKTNIVTVKELVRRTGLSDSHIYKILKGQHKITPRIAAALEVEAGLVEKGEDYLLLQMQHDYASAVVEFRRIRNRLLRDRDALGL